MRNVTGISVGLVWRQPYLREAEQVLEVKLVGDDGETVAKDWIDASEIRKWLGIGEPQ